jgi:enoyl-CoA hydratase/carnithine racemase
MSQYEFIKTETEGNLFIVTINRPDQLNCLHPMANAECGARLLTSSPPIRTSGSPS